MVCVCVWGGLGLVWQGWAALGFLLGGLTCFDRSLIGLCWFGMVCLGLGWSVYDVLLLILFVCTAGAESGQRSANSPVHTPCSTAVRSIPSVILYLLDIGKLAFGIKPADLHAVHAGFLVH